MNRALQYKTCEYGSSHLTRLDSRCPKWPQGGAPVVSKLHAVLMGLMRCYEVSVVWWLGVLESYNIHSTLFKILKRVLYKVVLHKNHSHRSIQKSTMFHINFLQGISVVITRPPQFRLIKATHLYTAINEEQNFRIKSSRKRLRICNKPYRSRS